MAFSVLKIRAVPLFALGLLVCGSLIYLQYRDMQLPRHRGIKILVDFPSYLLSFVTRPLLRRLFTIPESDWNRDREVEGLQNPVDVYRDDMGIPYIFAHTDSDAYFAQIFLEYTERPFQYELLRRLATGRLSETFGEEALATDYRARLLVDADSLRYALTTLSPRQKAHLDNAVRALNQAAALLPAVPIEFVALGWRPTEWTLLEYLQLMHAMYFHFTHGFTIEYSRAGLQRHLGDYWQTFDVDSSRWVPVLNEEGEFPSLFDQQGNRMPLPALPKMSDAWATRSPADLEKMVNELRRVQASDSPSPAATTAAAATEQPHAHATGVLGDVTGHVNVAEWAGSNAWAISGRFTTSGKPILAADTHLRATAPGFWMPVFVSVGPSKLLSPQQLASSSRLGKEGGREEEEKEEEEGSSIRERRAASVEGQETEYETQEKDKRNTSEEQQQQRITGTSAVGLGMICVGHNKYGAWGQTISGTDAADLFLIKINAEGTHYQYDGNWIPLRTRVETFLLKGKKLEKTLRYTHHGPLISDVIPVFQNLLAAGEALALAYVGARAPLVSDYFDAMAKAKTWEDFLAAAALNQQLGLTTVWATVAGDIGGTLGGSVPTRPPSSAKYMFRDGSSSAAEWNGVLPQAKMPHAVNPKRGFIGMANSKLSEDPQGLYGISFDVGYRQRRVTELLLELTKRKKKVTVEDMITMQNDVHNIDGREFRDFALQTILFAFKPEPTAAAAQQQPDAGGPKQPDGIGQQQQHPDAAKQQQPLDAVQASANIRAICNEEGLSEADGTWLYKTMVSWNADMTTESIGATVYEVWKQWILQILFEKHQLPPEALDIVLGAWPEELWVPMVEISKHWRYSLLHAMKRNKKVIADVTTTERLLCSSAAAALKYLRERYGDKTAQWEWGAVRTCFIDHPLAAALPLLRHTASVGPLRWGGSAETIKAHSSRAAPLSSEKPWKKNFATAGDSPVLRMVVDLGDFKNSFWAVLPGVSGWLGNPHYDDFASSIEAATGTDHMRPMLWTDEQIEAAAVTHMKLLPKTLPVEGKKEKRKHQIHEEL